MDRDISTADVPERDRIAFWRSAIDDLLGLESQIVPDDQKGFDAHLTLRSSGALRNLRYSGDRHPVRRSRADISRRPLDSYWIYLEGSHGVWLDHAGREFATQAGDMVIADADAPFQSQPADGVCHGVWLLGKAVLDPYLPAGGRPLSIPLRGRTGLDSLAGTFLRSLSESWDTMPEASMGAVIDTLCRLIGIACGAAAAGEPCAVLQARLAAARRHIDQNLTNLELSPASTAAALKISVRSLHALFEQTGTSFARHVLQRRLQECRVILLANPTRPVIDIAFAWGFGSLSSFYRAFHAAFGMSPGEAREAARMSQG